MIKNATAHNIASTWIPRVVFPEGEQPAGAERTEDVIDCVSSFISRNVMKDTVAKAQIELSGGLVLIEEQELGLV